MKTIQITKKELTTVLEILKKHLTQDTIVWVFGSRANHTQKPFSDLDLAIEACQEIPYATWVHIKHDFEESDLPYKVDLVDWHLLDPSFQANIAPYKQKTKLDFSSR